MSPGGDISRDDNPAGIRLILQEIRDIKADMRDLKAETLDTKKELTEFHREAAEDRKQAAEDRKQAALDREQAAETQKGIRQALVIIGNAGRRILQTQDRHTKILEEIRDILKYRGNGRPRRNGR